MDLIYVAPAVRVQAAGCLGAVMEDMGSVHAQREAGLVAESEAEPHAVEARPRKLPGLHVVAVGHAGVIERQNPQAAAVQTETLGDIRAVNLPVGAVALVVGAITLVESAHVVSAADRELLARNQGVVRVLGIEPDASLPVAQK